MNLTRLPVWRQLMPSSFGTLSMPSLKLTAAAPTRVLKTRPGQPRHVSTTSKLDSQYRRFGDPPRQSAARSSGNPRSQLQLPAALFQNSSSSSSSSKRIFGRFRRPPPIVIVILAGGGVYYIAHLERVERTGRLRFMDVSASTEQQMGAQSFNEVMGEYGNRVLPDRHPTARYVQDVVKRIVRANGLEAGPGGWETHVVADEGTRNAFVLPGGKIFVFSGILPIAQDADGLAVILEIAHQVARHSAERMSSLKVLFVLSLALESLGLDAGMSRVLLNLVMTLPNSRKSESEADYIGLQLANAACFDIRAARGLWQRMNQAEGGGGKRGGVNVDFLSTHPSSSKRVDTVTAWSEQLIKDRPYDCGPLERQADAFRAASRSRW